LEAGSDIVFNAAIPSGSKYLYSNGTKQCRNLWKFWQADWQANARLAIASGDGPHRLRQGAFFEFFLARKGRFQILPGQKMQMPNKINVFSPLFGQKLTLHFV